MELLIHHYRQQACEILADQHLQCSGWAFDMHCQLSLGIQVVRDGCRPQFHILVVLVDKFTDIRMHFSSSLISEDFSISIQPNNLLEFVGKVDDVLNFNSFLEYVVLEGLQFRFGLFYFRFERFVEAIRLEQLEVLFQTLEFVYLDDLPFRVDCYFLR